LASSFLWAALGHINTLDMGVTFCMTLGLVGFLLAQRGEIPTRETRRWMWLAWAAMGLAFLSKGLIGLVLPGAALVLYALLERDWSFVRRLDWIRGIAIVLAVTLPWLIAVSIANPEFLRFFFIHEHFERFLTQAHHRTAPWWYFVPILAGGLLPWTPMFVQSVVLAWKRDAAPAPFRLRRFLLIYAAVIFLFFSVSQSKLPSYILPIFPALALLLGEWLAQVGARKLAWLIVPVAILALAAALAAPLMAQLDSEKVPAALYAIFGRWILAAALALFVAAVIALVLARRERIDAALITLGAGGLLFLQIGMTGHEALSPSYSTAHLAGMLRPLAGADTPFYSVRTYEQTLPFYIKRTVTLVDYRDELDFGLQQEPQREIPTLEEFEARWRKDPKALAIMGPDVYQTLTARGLPMRLLYEDARRVIVSKP
jgi:4-amino-4-deoxy-L-arabinose transferase-like glycosyltransferase